MVGGPNGKGRCGRMFTQAGVQVLGARPHKGRWQVPACVYRGSGTRQVGTHRHGNKAWGKVTALQAGKAQGSKVRGGGGKARHRWQAKGSSRYKVQNLGRTGMAGPGRGSKAWGQV